MNCFIKVNLNDSDSTFKELLDLDYIYIYIFYLYQSYYNKERLYKSFTFD